MKKLDILLKAAAIALFIVNISNTLSIIAFSIYCLLQQSGVTFMSIGTPKHMHNKAKMNQDIEDYIQEHYKGEHTISHITTAILETCPATKEDLNFFIEIIRRYKRFLSFKQIKATIETNPNDKTPIINSCEEVAVYQEFFTNNIKPLPNDYYHYLIKLWYTRPLKPSPSKEDKLHSFTIGYPQHFQIVITLDTSKDKLFPTLGIMLQVGNQYKLKAELNTQAAKHYALSLMVFISYCFSLSPLALTASLIIFLIATCQHTEDDFFTFNIGHDPISPASSLYGVNPETGKITYSFGVIMFNIMINLLLFYSFSFFGAVSILSIIPLYPIIAAAVITAYDRLLIILELSPYLSSSMFQVTLKNKQDTTQCTTIWHPKPCGIMIPEEISNIINIVHLATTNLIN